MGRSLRIITKGDIRRGNLYSILVIILLLACFGAWVYINQLWTAQALAVDATVLSIENSPRGPLAVIEWQVDGKHYRRAAEGAPSTVGGELEVRYLPSEPQRALTTTEWQAEPQRLIGLPALIVFVLLSLLRIWMHFHGPRRADDREVVARVMERD